MDRSLDDALSHSTSSHDYQKKMAKAMRLRAERHDQQLTLLKEKHAKELAEVREEAAQREEEAAAQARATLENAMLRESDRLEK
jgi:hypothetical protein